MFLKRIVVDKAGKAHTYWALVESFRTQRGPRHRTVAYLGELGASERAGWAKLQRMLDGQPDLTPDLFETAAEVPKHVLVDVRHVRVQRLRDFVLRPDAVARAGVGPASGAAP